MGQSFTPRENRRRFMDGVRIVKSGLAGCENAKAENRIDRINDAAEERWNREAEAMYRTLEQAKDSVAAAKVAVRTADRSGARAAKDALKQAENTLQRVRNAARKYDL